MGPGSENLGRYLHDIAEHRLLSAAEEVDFAIRVRDAEIDYWRTLLGYPPVVDVVRGVLLDELSEVPRGFRTLKRMARDTTARGALPRAERARWEKTTQRLGEQLRVLDKDRVIVRACHEAVAGLARGVDDPFLRRVVRSASYRQYLENVDKAQHAQQEAKNSFVAANLRLVIAMAKRYARGALSLEDLIQEGNLGLMKAVERFDHNRGHRFSTYASWWIRHALTRALADKGRLVRVPVHVLDTHSRIAKAEARAKSRRGRTPDLDELEAELDVPAAKLADVKENVGGATMSLDRPAFGDDERSFMDLLVDSSHADPVDVLANDALCDEVVRQLDTLTPREARVLRLRYGMVGDRTHTLSEIGEQYDLSRERIRQIEMEALQKIRARMDEGPSPERGGEASADETAA